MRDETGVTVAIDGPAGAGKSTVAKRVAQTLGYTLVDTGALYRAVALAASRAGIAWDDDHALGELVGGLEVSFNFQDGINHVYLGLEDVTTAIRTPDMSMGASNVSAQPTVRKGLLDLQRRLGGTGGAVLEGRDIGTVVFPDAPVKFYLDASLEERARRRWAELKERGKQIDLDEIQQDVARRDAQDMGRAHAPLRPADDAIIIDSTKIPADGVVEQIVAKVRQVAGA